MRITSILSNILRQHASMEDARAYYSYRGVGWVDVDEAGDRVLLELNISCSQLTQDNKCMLHDTPEKKPYMCHKYPWFVDDIETCGYSFIEKK